MQLRSVKNGILRVVRVTVAVLMSLASVLYVGKADNAECLSQRKAAHQREKQASGDMFYAPVQNVRVWENKLLAHYKSLGQAQLNKHESSNAADAPGFVYALVGTSALLQSAPLHGCGTHAGDRAAPTNVRPAGPLKQDGTPDMRYTANRAAIASARPAGPLKQDGTPDMRYAANRAAIASSRPAGPLKKDGTPDMRYAANRAG